MSGSVPKRSILTFTGAKKVGPPWHPLPEVSGGFSKGPSQNRQNVGNAFSGVEKVVTFWTVSSEMSRMSSPSGTFGPYVPYPCSPVRLSLRGSRIWLD